MEIWISVGIFGSFFSLPSHSSPHRFSYITLKHSPISSLTYALSSSLPHTHAYTRTHTHRDTPYGWMSDSCKTWRNVVGMVLQKTTWLVIIIARNDNNELPVCTHVRVEQDVCAWGRRVSACTPTCHFVRVSACHLVLWEILSCHILPPDNSPLWIFIIVVKFSRKTLMSSQHQQLKRGDEQMHGSFFPARILKKILPLHSKI